MSALRILLLVLGLAVVGFVAKYALTHSLTGASPAQVEPARQLDNVRQRAHAIEGELQRNADRAATPQDP